MTGTPGTFDQSFVDAAFQEPSEPCLTTTNAQSRARPPRPARRGLARIFGAGLITGAADDDPSGIATYSQAGAAYGYGLAWTMLFTLPLLAAVQEAAARVGRGTRKGIAANLDRRFPRWVVIGCVLLLAVANTINLGADLGAMGEAASLVIGGPPHPYVILFGAASAAAAVFIDYRFYVRVLRWLTLSLLAYAGTVLIVPVPWNDVLTSIAAPPIELSSSYLLAMTAVFGTTIAPYLIFWQAAEEVEDVGKPPWPQVAEPLSVVRREIRRIRLDTWIGIGFSNLVGLFVMIATAATLNRAGITSIQTAEQAAQALRPIAGAMASLAFAGGIIGTGLLAVPVLSGAAAYAIAEAAGRPAGLSRRPGEARTFYGVIALSTLIGTLLHFTPVDPMIALFASAVVNGILVVPILAALLIVAGSREALGGFRPGRLLLALGWATVVLMGATAVGLGAAWLR